MRQVVRTHQTIFLVKFTVLTLAIFAGVVLPRITSFWPETYWAGCGLLAVAFVFGRSIRTLGARWRFKRRMNAVIPATDVSDQNFLMAIGEAIRNNREERAFLLFENYDLRQPSNASIQTLRWLKTLAGVRWLYRHRAGRTQASYHQTFPQLHALMLAYPGGHVAGQEPGLTRELEIATSEDLDELAAGYIALVDELIRSLHKRNAPFTDEALRLLEFMTGRSFVLYPASRIHRWWAKMRPAFVRGGGAFLAGYRLLQMQQNEDAARLLTRLSDGGMLSDETDIMRRLARFLALFNRTQWRMTSSELPQYFHDGFHYMAVELGVLRYPTAELPEVVSCCRRRRVLHESKMRMIDDTLRLWEAIGDDVAMPASLALRRLMSHRIRSLPGEVSAWRKDWERMRPTFDRSVALLMEGIVAAADKNYQRAENVFQEVSRLQPGSLPLVNLIYLRLQQKRQADAQALTRVLTAQYPNDAAAMISTGRLLAMYREDTKEAEALFQKALTLKQNDPEDSPVEAFICLGELKLVQGQYLESQQYFDNARTLDPTLPDPKLGLARVYLETRRYERAIEHLDEVLLYPQSFEARFLAHYLLYRAYHEMGNDRRAFSHLEQIPAPFFKEPDVLDEIACHLESGKRYQKAREFAERAMLLRTDSRSRNDDSDTMSAR